MNRKFTPPQEKIVTSVALEKDVNKWLKRNVSNRSYLINELIKRHMRREEMRQARELEARRADAQEVTA